MIGMTDSYKVSHYKQFPKDMEGSYYYIESRSKEKELRFFGLQALLSKYFFDTPKLREVQQWGKIKRCDHTPSNINTLDTYTEYIRLLPEFI